MIRPKKQGSRKHMTPLEKGLAISARRSGMSWDEIADALKRFKRTVQRACRHHPELFEHVAKIRKNVRS